MVARRPAIEPALPAFLEFAARRRAGRPQRPFDVGFLKARRAPRCGQPWPALAVRRHRRGSPAGSLTRDEAPNCKLGTLARTVPGHHDAQPPGARRRAGHRRRLHGLIERVGAAGRAHLRGAADLHLPRPDRPAPQAPPRRGPAARARRLRVPGRRGPACSTSASPCDLRARVRTYFTGSETRSRMGEMVGLAESVDHDPVRHGAGGRGPRAAADRRAQAPLQPAVALPRARRLGQAHQRGLPAAVRRARGPRRRRDLPRAVRLAGGPPSRRSPRCTRRSRSASAARGCRRAARPPRACSPRWVAAVRRATGRESVDDYAVHVAARPRSALAERPRRGRGARSSRHRAALGRPALRGGRRPPRPARRVRPGGARAPSGSRALDRLPRARRRPAQPRPRLGDRLVRHGRLAGAARRPAGVDPRPVVEPARHGRDGRARVPARAGGHRRGDRVPAALARRARQCGWSDLDGTWACPLAARAGRPTVHAAVGAAGLRSRRRHAAHVARPSAAAGATGAHDHRHRQHPVRGRPHPRGRRGHRRARRRQRGLLRHRRRRPGRHGPGPRARGARRRDRRTGSTRSTGVLATETHIAFRTYSRHDLEAAFALGLGSDRAPQAAAATLGLAVHPAVEHGRSRAGVDAPRRAPRSASGLGERRRRWRRRQGDQRRGGVQQDGVAHRYRLAHRAGALTAALNAGSPPRRASAGAGAIPRSGGRAPSRDGAVAHTQTVDVVVVVSSSSPSSPRNTSAEPRAGRRHRP